MPAAKYRGVYPSQPRYKRILGYHLRILDDLRAGLDELHRLKPGVTNAIARKHRLAVGTVTRAVWDLRKEGYLPLALPTKPTKAKRAQIEAEESDDFEPAPKVTPDEIEAAKQAIRRERGQWFEPHGPHKPDPRQFIRELQEWEESYVRREVEATRRCLFYGMIVTYGKAASNHAALRGRQPTPAEKEQP